MTGAEVPALSFNEIVALATKATRGAGLGWGHADDFGRAARWLAERNFAWEVPLCRLLEAEDSASRASRIIAVSDWAAYAPLGERCTVDHGPDAAWMVALIAGAIFGRPNGIAVLGQGTAIYLTPRGAMVNEGTCRDVGELTGSLAIVSIAPRSVEEHGLRSRPGPISAEALTRLSALADRTLVPASEASRTRGAGASQPDND